MTALAHRGAVLTALVIAHLSLAGEWHVTTNGTATAEGSRRSPWDIESALGGKQRIGPGDTLWLHRGTYKRPFENLGLGWPVRLAGRTQAPVQVRPWPGERVTIDGGLNVQPPATHLWIWDLEILVSEPPSTDPLPPDPTYQNLNRPWGGLNVSAGDGCKFINLILHDNAQGVSWWAGSTNSELYGCLIYDNGWPGTDRGHGHAIYTQNRDGMKTIADCVLTGGFGYTLHAYGSSRAFVDHYRVQGNIAYEAGTFLLGGGQPSRDIKVLTNVFYGVPVQLGYGATTNVDCELRGNLLVNGRLTINRFGRVTEQDNWLLGMLEPRPRGTRVVLRPNQYDPQRAHLAIFNWERTPTAAVGVSSFLRPGDRFRVLRPTDFYGEPVRSGIARGEPIELPTPTEFTVYVLLRR
jgi:hypothetical protein